MKNLSEASNRITNIDCTSVNDVRPVKSERREWKFTRYVLVYTSSRVNRIFEYLIDVFSLGTGRRLIKPPLPKSHKSVYISVSISCINIHNCLISREKESYPIHSIYEIRDVCSLYCAKYIYGLCHSE